MAPAGRDPSDDDLDGDDDLFGDRPRPSAPRSSRRGGAAPVRAWSPDGDAEETEEWDGPSGGAGRRRARRSSREHVPVYWRARDSLYFEPLVALAIVVLMLVGLFAFTQNWPPAYVVESRSMQHGPEDRVGLINAGDLVLAEKIPTSSIVPYVVGARNGVRTYGEYGDVLLYHPNGNTRATPIVHRAIFFLSWVGGTSSYSASDLQGLPCGSGANMSAGELYYEAGASGCATTGLTGEIKVFNVGWNSSAPVISLDLADSEFTGSTYGEHSGFVTMGDHNEEPDQTPINGGTTPTLSALVEPGWVLGVARGMVPWFGAFKLLLEGNARNVSSNSWQFLGLAIVAAILSAFGIHWALRQEGIESPMRRREEEEEAAERDERDEERSGPRRFFGAVRSWRGDDDEDDDLSEPRPTPPRERRPPARPPARSVDRDGRPRPRVHRTTRRRRTADEDDDRL